MRELSTNLLSQMYAQNSTVPFLELYKISHPDFDDIYLVNNNENIISNGIEYIAFPVKLTLTADDGESQREFKVEFANIGLELINEIRSVTSPMDCNIKIVLADNPDYIEIELDELKIKNLTYNEQTISASLVLDDFLNVKLSSERYGPANYPGIFN